MNKFIVTILCMTFWSFLCLTAGYFLCKKLTKPLTITQTETQWRYSTVYRDYPKMEADEILSKLKCYDKNEFTIELQPLQNKDNYRIYANLCEREAYKDIRIECSESGNWKMYLGIGAVTAVLVGIYMGGR